MNADIKRWTELEPTHPHPHPLTKHIAPRTAALLMALVISIFAWVTVFVTLNHFR